jgi:hypothetical protein
MVHRRDMVQAWGESSHCLDVSARILVLALALIGTYVCPAVILPKFNASHHDVARAVDRKHVSTKRAGGLKGVVSAAPILAHASAHIERRRSSGTSLLPARRNFTFHPSSQCPITSHFVGSLCAPSLLVQRFTDAIAVDDDRSFYDRQTVN